MKKLLIAILSIFILGGSANAAENLSFIYINGSNNNDEKMKNWYEKGISKLHPLLREKFLTNANIQKKYPKIGDLNIKEKPVIFFWGFNSQNELAFVKDKLAASKKTSSIGAYTVRSLISQYLHDAIWIQKSHNMDPTLDKLNEKIKAEAAQGNKIILYGYSAGTFVTYEYLFNKIRYMNLEELFIGLKQDEEFIKFVKENPRKNTCLSALAKVPNGLGTFSKNGFFVLNQNKKELKANYLKMDELTEMYCAPEDKVTGVVNFASPLVLFYSDIADESYQLNYCNKLMIKHLMENGTFLITVNFKEDPLGFPTSKNLTLTEIEAKLGIKLNNPSGVIYDNSGVWSKRLFPFAHTAYWSARKTFSTAVVDAFIDGHNHFYGKEKND